MKKLGLLLVCTLAFGCSITKSRPSTKPLLIEQLRNTYTHQDWFVPLKVAVADLSIEKVNWKDTNKDHSIGELVSHLIFWNERILFAFQGNKVPDFNDDNELTFVKYGGRDWERSLLKLDRIQTRWEQEVSKASDKQLIAWGLSIANMSSHTAYHTGQIIYIRKQNGWWDEKNGVK